ncbi:hypothetical protein HDU80_010932 [Chytriomyces hyalinus]|nr:hypothetical protein HDU80_010932 [Chytriomyces hyalinus]
MSSKKELFELIQQFRIQLNCAALPEAFRVPPTLGGNGFFSNTTGKLIFNNRVYCFTGASSTHLDNWSTCTLTIGRSTFQSSEQVIFAASKAGLFRDEAALMQATSTPAMSASQAKYLGRNVQNFVDTVWKTNARWLSDVAILIKCLQNAGAMEELVRTRGLMIAEGSKQDLVWGIGMEACYPASLEQNKWRGKNWLGQSLVRVRKQIQVKKDGKKDEVINNRSRTAPNPIRTPLSSIHSGARSVFESTPSSSAPAKRKRGSNLNAKYNDMHNQMIQLANMIDAKKENATPSSNRMHYKSLAPPSSAVSSSPSIYENTARMHQDVGLFYNDKKLGSHGGRFNFNHDSLSYVDNSPSARRAPLNPVAAYSSVNTSRLTKKLRVNDYSQDEEVKPKFSVLSSSNNPFEVNMHAHTYKPPVPPRPASSIPKTQGFIHESENHLVLDD